MKKALLCRQGKKNDDSNFIVSYSSLESHCPPFIPENKTKIIVWVWDCRIEKARQHKLPGFYLQLFNQWLIQEIVLNLEVQNNVHGRK